MKRLLTGLMAIALLLGLVGLVTSAYFSDVETSVNNSFATGTLDLYLTGGTQSGDSVINTWTTPAGWAPGDTASGTLTMDNKGTITMTKVKLSVAVTDSENGVNEPECVEGYGGSWADPTCTGGAVKNDISSKIEITVLTYNGVNILPALQTSRGNLAAPLLLSELNGLPAYDLIVAAGLTSLPGDGAGGTTHALLMTVQLQTSTGNEYQSDKSGFTFTILGEQ